MTYDELIVRMYFQAAMLSTAAWQVLHAAVANGIMQRSNRVRISSRKWASDTGMSREGVAMGLRELGHHLPLENFGKEANGNAGFIILPLDWISTQSRLSFMEDGEAPTLLKSLCKTGDRPGTQATHRPGTQATPAWLLGRYRQNRHSIYTRARALIDRSIKNWRSQKL